MKNIVMMVVLGFAATAGLNAGQGNLDKEAQVAALDKQWGNAWASCNLDMIKPTMSDDLVFIHTTGQVENKTVFLRNMGCNGPKGRATPLRLDTKSTGVRFYGPDFAVGTGRLEISGEERPTTTLLFTRVYVRQHGTWRIVSHQSTNAPKPQS